MRKITFLAALFISILFAACQNSDLELAQVENLTDGEQVTPLRETFDFTYKGESYSSPFYMENDTLMILEDEKVAVVYDRIQELPELATYVAQNGNIEYYDSFDELQSEKQLKEKVMHTNNSTKASNSMVKLNLYEHKSFNQFDQRGMMISFDISNSPLSIPRLKDYNFDDKLTSLTVVGPSLLFNTPRNITLFRNPDYKAQSITFTITGALSIQLYLAVYNLHDYKVKKGINWNDRVSSLKAHY